MLERIGVRGSTLNWFKNYLDCRTYRVRICDKHSEEVAIDCGVPQGSKLGPILYIIYANEMMSALEGNSTFAYADDTAIVVSDKNVENATQLMQKQLNTAAKWCHDNGLIINATKTKIMHIKPPHFTHSNIHLKYHNYECLHNRAKNLNIIDDSCDTNIELVETYKYLGVYVDNKFKWKTHIINLQKKLRKSAYMLCHLSYCSTYDVLRQAYYSLAESYLRHGITAWGGSTHCRLLQNTQNQFLKILQKNYHFSNNTYNNNQLLNNDSSNIQSNTTLHSNTSRNITNNTRPNTTQHNTIVLLTQSTTHLIITTHCWQQGIRKQAAHH